ncbi:MAG: hypothetical protein GWP05_01425 [Anaerolineaceae bacterium]|nr:hypothetical protein [Anaerolineaceae bacterium]
MTLRYRVIVSWLCVGAAVAMVSLPASCAEAPKSKQAKKTKSTSAAERIEPGDLVYKGAFRLPDEPEEVGWGWSGQGLAYRSDGDPKDKADGYPGSLFGVGHDWHQYISEITIPEPVVSAKKNLAELKTARTIQKFHDIRGKKFPEMEQARSGLAWLPKQGQQTSGKLYFCWGPHMDEGSTAPSHGWCETDLANPQTAGPWKLGGLWTYVTTDYIFPIPKAWADKHTPGMRLATGRFRDGGQGSQGPTIFAYGPWNEGNPPKAGATVRATTLLQYSSVTDQVQHKLKGYHHSDEWSGGAWLTSGGRSAVVFVGTKGQGKCWYGFANGVVWPEEGPWPPVPEAPNDQRGWWSSSFTAQIVFYDTGDLAEVAAGRKKPYEVQPFATLEIEKLLYRARPQPEFHHVGAAAFDRRRGLLYVIEFRGDEDKSLVHTWWVRPKVPVPAAG